MATDRTNISNSGGGFLVLPNQAVPVDSLPSTLGKGMQPEVAVPRLAGSVFYARGVGRNLLTENVPPGDVRFVRGPKIIGRQGTLDVWFTALAPDTERTLCYLTDDVDNPTNVLALRTDTSNRPLATITDNLGNVVGEVLPSYGSAAVAATGIMTLTANVDNGDTVTTGDKTYTFQTVLTNVDGNVEIGGSASITIDRLIAAITLGAGAGSTYALATTANPVVTVTTGAGDTMDTEALASGDAGNSIVVAEAGDEIAWDVTTLAGGLDGSYSVGSLVHVRLSWDSVNTVNGTQHAILTVKDEVVPGSDWSTDPTAAWTHFQPTHLVLAEGFDTDSDITDVAVVRAAQASNTVVL